MKNNENAVRKRLRGKDRQKVILDQAAELFSELGFNVSTRQIARKCGITQAALYKHFTSKEAIVSGVFQTFFLDSDKSYFADELTREALTGPEKITNAYMAFFQRIDRVKQRVFLLAALQNYKLPQTFSAPLDHEILEPLVGQLREELGYKPLDIRSMSNEERELVMMLHSTVVFLALRLNIYGIDRLKTDHEWIISQNVQTWHIGAIQMMGKFAQT